MNKKLLFFAAAFSVALGAFVIGSWVVADLVIAPAPGKVSWPADAGFLPEEVSFQASDSVGLKGWFLPQARSTSAVVLLHGIHANRDQVLDRALWLHGLGYNVLLYDARGDGESARVHPSFGYGETKDLLGALDWLQSRGMKGIACIGTSQGAATILLASGELPLAVRAVVPEASYSTLRTTTDDHFRERTGLPSAYFGALVVPMAEWRLGFNMDDVSPLREIAKLKIPVYLIGGASDVLAPPAGVRALYEAAPCEKNLWMVPGAGHIDFFSYANKDYEQRIGDFLEKHLAP
jgi:fermentation-respiration switch protein FrsA (DUF1100 family)